jgi:hypothetical protein
LRILNLFQAAELILRELDRHLEAAQQ